VTGDQCQHRFEFELPAGGALPISGRSLLLIVPAPTQHSVRKTDPPLGGCWPVQRTTQSNEQIFHSIAFMHVLKSAHHLTYLQYRKASIYHSFAILELFFAVSKAHFSCCFLIFSSRRLIRASAFARSSFLNTSTIARSS